MAPRSPSDTRRRRGLRALVPIAAVVVALVVTLSAATSADSEPNPSLGRAHAAYAAMQKQLFDSRTLLYRGAGNKYAWPYGRAVDATIAIAELPGAGPRARADVRTRLRGLARYWNARRSPPAYEAAPRPPLGRGAHVYYDDNEWIGLELLRAYDLTHDRSQLAQARRVLHLITTGWDRRAKACPGGVMWTTDPHGYQRGTVTNGPGALLASGIYDKTHDRKVLAWAKRMWSWADRCMLDPAKGLYQDHFRPDGSRDTTVWTYNQGTMIGAALALYRQTGQERFLDAARRRAAAALDYFDDTKLASEPPYFLAIYFRELLPFESMAGGSEFRAKLERYADNAWNHLRDPRTGLFGGAGAKGKSLLVQASMVEIYALLARE